MGGCAKYRSGALGGGQHHPGYVLRCVAMVAKADVIRPIGMRLYGPLLPAFLLCTAVNARPSVAQTVRPSEADRQIAQGLNLVVKVHTNDPWHGGGIIVGTSADSIYIVTARHVLDEGSPDSVRVWFHFNQSNEVAARVFSDTSTDKSLSDVALISVARRSALGFEKAGSNSIAWVCLINSMLRPRD